MRYALWALAIAGFVGAGAPLPSTPDHDPRTAFRDVPTVPFDWRRYNGNHEGRRRKRDPANPKLQAAERKRAKRAAKRLAENVSADVHERPPAVLR